MLRPATVRALAALALTALLLAGCSSSLSTPGEALRILGATLAPAYLGQPYDQPVQAVGGLRPFSFTLADGQLPPGITLEGGTLRGTPSKIGRYTFTLQVTDANLSKTVQKYTLAVAQLPPPALDFNVPDTEVDHRITLRVQVSHARKLQGLRTQARWDPTRFELVPGSVRASRQGLAVLQKASAGQLEVALAPLGTELDGQATLFQFDLKPVAGASYLKLDAETEFISAQGHHFAQTSEGRSPSGSSGAAEGAPPSTPSSTDGSAPSGGADQPTAPSGGAP